MKVKLVQLFGKTEIVCQNDMQFDLSGIDESLILERNQDNLIFKFEDDSSIELVNFYTVFTDSEAVLFTMNDAEISVKDFFSALGADDLAPAAGDSSSNSAERQTHTQHYVDLSLLDGIDRLNGLDIGFNSESKEEIEFNNSGLYSDDDSTENGLDVNPINDDPINDNPIVEPIRPIIEPKNIEFNSYDKALNTAHTGNIFVKNTSIAESITKDVYDNSNNKIGVITVDTNGDVVFEQTNPCKHDDGTDVNSFDEKVTIKYKLDDGTVIEKDVDVKINIYDDVPNVDVLSNVDEIHYSTDYEYVGKIDYDFGADGKGDLIVKINDTIATKIDDNTYYADEIGTIKINDDNTVEFKNDYASGSDKEVNIKFVITDFDNDKDIDDFSFDVVSDEIEPSDIEFTSYDTKLNTEYSNTVAIENTTIVEEVTKDVYDNANNKIGTIIIGIDGKITFEQTENCIHDDNTDMNTFDEVISVKYQLEDGTVVEKNINVKVNVYDDVPVIVADNTVESIDYSTDYTQVGKVDYDFGADTTDNLVIKINDIVATKIDDNTYYASEIGTVKIEDGTVSFKNEYSSGSDKDITISFAVTDADNDTDEDSFTFSVEQKDITVDNVEFDSYDTKLNTEYTDTVAFKNTTIVEEVTKDVYDNANNKIGTITIDTDGNITFEQTDTCKHDDGTDVNSFDEIITIQYKLDDGTIINKDVMVTVNVYDDVPVIDADNTVESIDYSTDYVQVGKVDYDFGADDKGDLVVKINDTETIKIDDNTYYADGIGTVKIDDDGNVSFKNEYASGSDKEINIKFVITDSDNDTDESDFSFDVIHSEIEIEDVEFTSYDTKLNTEYTDTVAIENTTIVEEITKDVYDNANNKIGTITIGTDGKVLFEQDTACIHDDETDVNSFNEVISVKYQLEDGTVVEKDVNVKINVYDDEPDITATNTVESIIYSTDYVQVGTVDYSYGADTTDNLVIKINGTETTKIDNNTYYVDNIGTIKIDTDGKVFFKNEYSSGSDKDINISFTITDADNDTDESNFSFGVVQAEIESKNVEFDSYDTKLNTEYTDTVAIDNTTIAETVTKDVYDNANNKIGTITIDTDGKVTFEQIDTCKHDTDTDVNSFNETVTVKYQLDDGTVIEKDINVTVNVYDDVPVIDADNTVESIDYSTDYTQVGKVDYDFGADGKGDLVVKINDTEATKIDDNTYYVDGIGTVKIDDNDNVSFKNEYASGFDEEINIKFVITDSDGDKDIDDFTFDVVQKEINPENIEFTSYDTKLNTEYSNSVAIENTNIEESVTKDVYDNANNKIGTITIGTDGKITFEQTENCIHDDSTDVNSFVETITVNYVLGDGNVVEKDINVKINVYDDEPTITSNNTVESITYSTDYTQVGKVDYDFGADEKGDLVIKINDVVATKIDDTYYVDGIGAVKIDTDGTVSFKNEYVSGSDKEISISFAITDADNDTDESDFSFSVVQEEIEPSDVEFTSYDTKLNTEYTDNISIENTSIVEEVTKDVYDNANNKIGTITIDINGKVTFEQDTACIHDDNTDMNTFDEVISVKYQLEDGTVVEKDVNVKINVYDDEPTITSSNTIESIDYSTDYVQVGKVDYDFGADINDNLAIKINGIESTKIDDNTYYVDNIGTIKIDDNGNVSFKNEYNSGSDKEINVKFIITDADNDTDESDFTFDVVQAEIEPENVEFDSYDTKLNTEYTDTVAVENTTIVEEVTKDVYDNANNKIGTITIDIDGKVTFEQIEACKHDTDTDVNSFNETVTVKYQFDDGTVVEKNVTVTVNVYDDEPDITATNTVESITYSTDYVQIGKVDYDFGADDKGDLIIKINDTEATKLDDNTYYVDGIGTVKIDDNGNVSFKNEYASGSDKEINIKFVITDSDGDSDIDDFSFDIVHSDIGSENVEFTSYDTKLNTEYTDTVAIENTTIVESITKDVYDNANNNIGTITIDTDGKIVFEQTENCIHDDNTDMNTFDEVISVKYQLEDGTVVEKDVNVKINVYDDVPAIDATNTVESIDYSTDYVQVGTVDYSYGADTTDNLVIKINNITANKNDDNSYYVSGIGTVKIDGNNVSFKNEYNSGSDKDISISFVITDADNDTSESDFTFSVDQKNITIGNVEFTSYDTKLNTEYSNSISIENTSIAEAVTKYVYDNANNNIGTITIDTNGDVKFEQTYACKHDDNTDINSFDEVISVKFKLDDGTIIDKDVTVKVNVYDDVPSITSNNTVESIIYLTDYVQVGIVDYSYGADITDNLVIKINSVEASKIDDNTYYVSGIGSVKIENNTVLFKNEYNSGSDNEIDIKFIITDADNDTNESNFSFDIIHSEIESKNVEFISYDTKLNTEYTDTVAIENTSIVETVTKDVYDNANNKIGTITIGTDGKVLFEQDTVCIHDDNTDMNIFDEVVSVKYQLEDGSIVTKDINVKVNVYDDEPTITATSTVESVGYSIDYVQVGTVDYDFGADTTDNFVIKINGTEAIKIDDNTYYVSKIGTVKIDNDGKVSFKNEYSSGVDKEVNIKFVITDADNDTDESDFSFSIVQAKIEPSDVEFTSYDTKLNTEYIDNVTIENTSIAKEITKDVYDNANNKIGTITIGTDGKVTFEQIEACKHDADTDVNSFNETIAVKYQLDDGTVVEKNVTVTVNVYDDEPDITATNIVESINYSTDYVLVGTVDYDFGADDKGDLIIKINDTEATKLDDETYYVDGIGTVKIDTDGNVSFKNDYSSGIDKEVNIKFVITDSDGDNDIDDFSFDIIHSEIESENVEFTSYDTKLNTEYTDTVAVENTTIVETVVKDVYDNANNKIGTITIDTDGKVTFEQTENCIHDDNTDMNTFNEVISVKYKLEDGTVVEKDVNVKINVYDDEPTITSSNTVESINYSTNYVQVGTVDYSYGADITDNLVIKINDTVATKIDDTYYVSGVGTVTIDDNGNVSFKNDYASGSDKEINIKFVVTDADNDTDESDFSFGVVQANIEPENVEFTSYDTKLNTEYSNTVTIENTTIVEEVTKDVYDNANNKIGTINIGTDGKITFEQDTACIHDDNTDMNTFNEVVSVKYQLEDGTVVEKDVNVKVNVYDDVPVIIADNTVESINYSTDYVQVGIVDYSYGADASDNLVIKINGIETTKIDNTYYVSGIGSVKIENNIVSFKNEYSSGSDKEISISFAITDADNDTNESSFSFDVSQAKIEPENVEFTSYDTKLNTEYTDTVAIENTSIEKIVTKDVYDNANNKIGTITIGTDGKVSFEQDTACIHDDNTDVNSFVETITVNYVLGDDSIVTKDINVKINVYDDEPDITATNTVESIIYSTDYIQVGTVDYSYGADITDNLVIKINDVIATKLDDGTYYVDGIGTVNIENSVVSFKNEYNSGSDKDINIKFVITDADNDTDESDFTFNVVHSEIESENVEFTSYDTKLNIEYTDTVAIENTTIVEEVTKDVYDNINNKIGTITIDTDGKVIFEQDTACIHDDNTDMNTFNEVVSVKYQLEDGTVVEKDINVKVNVYDDVPVIVADNTVESINYSINYTQVGTVEYVFGADTSDNLVIKINDIIATKIDDTYYAEGIGTVNIENGVVSFKNAYASGSDKEINIKFIITDADNDTDESDFTFSVNQENITVDNVEFTSYDTKLNTEYTDTIAIENTTISETATKDVYDNANNKIGTITIDTDGKVTFKQTENCIHDDNTDMNTFDEVVAVKYKLDDGTVVEKNVTITVNVYDDVPDITATSTVETINYSTSYVKVGHIDYSYGADTTDNISLFVNNTKTSIENGIYKSDLGEFKINANGDVYFKSNYKSGNETNVDLNFVITDSDNDTDSSSFDFIINKTDFSLENKNFVSYDDDLNDEQYSTVSLPYGKIQQEVTKILYDDYNNEIGYVKVTTDGKIIYNQNKAYQHLDNTDVSSGKNTDVTLQIELDDGSIVSKTFNIGYTVNDSLTKWDDNIGSYHQEVVMKNGVIDTITTSGNNSLVNYVHSGDEITDISFTKFDLYNSNNEKLNCTLSDDGKTITFIDSNGDTVLTGKIDSGYNWSFISKETSLYTNPENREFEIGFIATDKDNDTDTITYNIYGQSSSYTIKHNLQFNNAVDVTKMAQDHGNGVGQHEWAVMATEDIVYHPDGYVYTFKGDGLSGKESETAGFTKSSAIATGNTAITISAWRTDASGEEVATNLNFHRSNNIDYGFGVFGYRNYNRDSSSSIAETDYIKVDLGHTLAYGVNINLGSLSSDETAIVEFRLEGSVVASYKWTGDSSVYKTFSINTSNDDIWNDILYNTGFDEIVIKADTDTDFTFSGISFVTKGSWGELSGNVDLTSYETTPDIFIASDNGEKILNGNITISYNNETVIGKVTTNGILQYVDIFDSSEKLGTLILNTETGVWNVNWYNASDTGNLKIPFIVIDENGNTSLDQFAEFNFDLSLDRTEVEGTLSADILLGGNYNDVIEANNGNDIVYAGNGNDTVYGGKGNDTIQGDNVYDNYITNDQTNNTSIPTRNDVLNNINAENKHDDTIVGGSGDDTIVGGYGNDILIGDGSNSKDTPLEIEKVNSSVLSDMSRSDLNNYSDAVEKMETTTDGNDTLRVWYEENQDNQIYASGRYATGTSTNIEYDSSKIDDAVEQGDNVLYGMGGNDSLYGGAGNDFLFGGSGNDYLNGGNGTDYINGGSGNDIMVYNTSGFFEGGNELDVLLVSSGLVVDKSNVNNVELVVGGLNDAMIQDLTSMDKLSSELGVTISSGTVSLDNNWTEIDSYHYTNNDYTLEVTDDVTVQKIIMENNLN